MATLCRMAKSSDLDDINILFQSTQRGSAAFSRRQEIIYKRILDETLIDLIVVEKDEYIVGCCHCAIIPTLSNDGRPYAMLSHFLIDPLNREQGLATLLLEHSLTLAKKRGCYKIYAEIESAKDWQVKLLTRVGFEQQQSVFIYQ